MTLCNLNIEMGGRSGFVPPDDATFAWIAGRPWAPQGAQWDAGVAHWRTLRSDDDAEFDKEHTLDCTKLEPQITWGTDPSQTVGISDRVPDPSSDPNRRDAFESALRYMDLKPGMALAGLPVNRVFIGSCTNARLPDLEAAADVVRGRKVARGRGGDGGAGLRPVKREAEAKGLDKVFRDAGFFWGESGCSMCAGGNGDKGEPGERIVSTTNRNFENRQGPKTRTHLASPATAAATAIAGRIADVRSISGNWPDAAVQVAYRRRRPAHQGRHQHRPGRAGAGVPQLKPDYKTVLFSRAKLRDDGSEDPEFVLNKPQFRNPGILVTGNNFGAGSSREAAVWSMLANNIRVIVARSFADIYRENCLQNGLLPVVLNPGDAEAFEQRVIAANGSAPFTVDLETQTISGPGGPDIKFDIPAADRTRLLEGLDDIGLTLKHSDEIKAWEKRTAAAHPWLQEANRQPASQVRSVMPELVAGIHVFRARSISREAWIARDNAQA